MKCVKVIRQHLGYLRLKYRKSIFYKRRNIQIIKQIVKLAPVDDGYSLVRIGPDGDGGYLSPNNFEGISKCFSAGCDQAWEFERELDYRFGITSYIIDTEDKRAPDFGSKQIFTPGLLGVTTDPKNRRLSIKEWMNLFLQDENETNLLLQMDIEGDEWEILLNMDPDDLLKFRMIIIEFHNLSKVHNKLFFESLFVPVVSKITKEFNVVHVHPNNCCPFFEVGRGVQFPQVVEVTLHRKKNSLLSEQHFRLLPHDLDKPNIQDKPTKPIVWENLFRAVS